MNKHFLSPWENIRITYVYFETADKPVTTPVKQQNILPSCTLDKHLKFFTRFLKR